MSSELAVFDAKKAEIQAFVAPIAGVRVASPEDSQKAIDALKMIKFLGNELEKLRVGLVKPLKDRAKQIDTYVGTLEEPLLKAEKHLKAQCSQFDDQLRAQAQAKLAEERKAREEEERMARERQLEIAAEIEEKRQFELASLKDKQDLHLEAADLFGDEEPGPDLADERRRIDAEAERERLEAQARSEREQIERDNLAKQREWDIANAKTKGMKRVWDFDIQDLEAVPRQYLKIEVNRAMVLAAARGGVKEIAGIRLFQKSELSVGAHTRIPSQLLASEE